MNKAAIKRYSKIVSDLIRGSAVIDKGFKIAKKPASGFDIDDDEGIVILGLHVNPNVIVVVDHQPHKIGLPRNMEYTFGKSCSPQTHGLAKKRCGGR